MFSSFLKIMDPSRFRLSNNDVVKLTAPPKTKPAPRHRGDEWFLKGPIPGYWLMRATALGLVALRVGLAVWCEYGMRRSQPVRLSAEMQRRFSISPNTCRRGLKALSDAELVAVVQLPGRRPEITILETSDVKCDVCQFAN